MDDIQLHSCGRAHAHGPHPSRMLAGWWCPGILPIWPCSLSQASGPMHDPHYLSAGNFLCPGTSRFDPPRDMVGPPYSIVDICAVIEALQEIENVLEETS